MLKRKQLLKLYKKKKCSHNLITYISDNSNLYNCYNNVCNNCIYEHHTTIHIKDNLHFSNVKNLQAAIAS